MIRFIARLLHFYNPSIDNGFCTISLSDSNARMYTSVGLLLIEKILLLGSDESLRHLESLLNDLCHCLSEVSETPLRMSGCMGDP